MKYLFYIFCLLTTAFTATAQNDTVTVDLGYGFDENVKTSAMAISTVTDKTLNHSSQVNLGKALYGQLPGLQVMQSSDPNTTSGVSIMLRGTSSLNNSNPLILVDGVPRDINEITLLEVESVSVLKDAAACALYGTRGANGVIQITTKRGHAGPLDIDVNYRVGLSTPFRMQKMVDAATYAETYNEALLNDGITTPRYTEEDIALFRSGLEPYTHPNSNWVNEAFKNVATNHQLDFNISGGSDKFHFFTGISYSFDEGHLKHTEEDEDGRYTSQLRKSHLSVRANMDAKLTRTTIMKLGLLGRISEIHRPKNMSGAFSQIYKTPAAAFPIYSPNGNYASTPYYKYNPIATLGANGYSKDLNRSLFADLRLIQKLDFITEGLSAEAMMAYDNFGDVNETGTRIYSYDALIPVSPGVYDWQNYANDTYMNYGSRLNQQSMTNQVEVKLQYDRTVKKHDIFAAVLYNQFYSNRMGRENTTKRQSIMAYANYNYGNRYVLNAVVNYAGSAVMPKGDRFEVYPAISGAWIISNEKFFQSGSIDLLKIRASWGLSGSDMFAHMLYRQFYEEGKDYPFVPDQSSSHKGGKESTLAVPNLKMERSNKVNIGIDFAAFRNRLNLTADVFSDYRDRILVDGSGYASNVLGIGVSKLPIGKVLNRGVEANISWNDHEGDFKYAISGNFSYVHNQILENGETPLPWELRHLSRKGSSIGQFLGYEAEGLFMDEHDIAISNEQHLGSVRPGDIKYKDQNFDGIIDGNDFVNLGHSGNRPQIYYGLNIDLAYKGFELFAVFQGVAQREVMLTNSYLNFPLAEGRNLSQWYHDQNYWTEATKETAVLPRLTTVNNPNNNRASSLWMRDGSYFKLRHLEFSYEIPRKLTKFVTCKFFLRGHNLFSVDKLKTIDPENTGAGYPSLRSYMFGLNLHF